MTAPQSSSSFALASPASGRGQFQEYLFARSSKAIPQTSASPFTGAVVKKSLPKRDTNFVSDRQIVAPFTAAILSMPIQEVAEVSGATEIAVKNWRVERNAPGFTRAMRAGRNVPRIRDAILEILGIEMPEKNRVISVLLSHLAHIASSTDEVSAARARLALSEFAEMTP